MDWKGGETKMFMIDLGALSHYSVLGVSPDADPGEIRKSQSKIAGDLAREFARVRNPEEKRRIQEKQQNINAIGEVLSRADKRAQYDESNVHLTFFQIRKAVAPVLAERELLMRWMHQSIRRFLLEKGELLEPVSDLEREEFSGDYSPNELLDGLLRGKQE
jgi:curved DNA-binding protein CbpA